MHALSAAGLAFSLTRRCRSGQLVNCGCDMTTGVKGHNDMPPLTADTELRWSGCSDNIEYGVAFSRLFSDKSSLTRRRKKTDVRYAVMERRLVKLHNAETARTVSAFSLCLSL